MDALNVGFRYHPYPDERTVGPTFELPALDLWLQVAASHPTEADERAAAALVSQGPVREVVILFGRCWYPWDVESYGGWAWWRNADNLCGWHAFVVWRECAECGWRCLADESEACPQCAQQMLVEDSERLRTAYEEANLLAFPPQGGRS